MIYCRVLGNVVASKHHSGMDDRRVMIVQPIDPADKNPRGNSFIAVDTVSSCPGEIVLVNKEGGSSRIAVRWDNAPIHSTITAIVDETTITANAAH
jgi:microcompartment protein CcmK/EutM